MYRSEVCGTLDRDDEDRQQPRYLVHLAPAGLTLHLHFPETGDEHRQKLHHDG